MIENLIPFKRKPVEPEKAFLRDLHDFVKDFFHARKLEMGKYWDYYEGEQSKYLEKYEHEDYQEYLARVRSAIIENHAAPTIDIPVAYMYGSGAIGRRAEDENLHNILHNEVYQVNDMDTLMIDVRLQAAITGFSIVHPVIVSKRTRMPFYVTGEQMTQDNFTVLYTLMDSIITIPLPRTYDKRSLGAIIQIYTVDTDSLSEQFKREGTSTFNVVEYADDHIWIRYLFDEEDMDNPLVLPTDLPDGGNVNPFGDVRCLFVLFKNAGFPFDLEGRSEIKGIVDLQNALNERLTDDQSVIRYHSAPILKFLKGAMMPDGFVRKANSVLEFEGDGDAEYLTWEDKLDASSQYVAQLRQAIALATQVSNLSRGNLKDAGQVRTGMGVKSLYVPDTTHIRLRRPFMIRGEKELIYATAKFYEMYGGVSFSSYKAEITMPDDFIGIEKWLETQVMSQEIASGIPPVERIKEKFPDMTEEQINEIIDMIMGNSQKGKVTEAPEAKVMKQ